MIAISHLGLVMTNKINWLLYCGGGLVSALILTIEEVGKESRPQTRTRSDRHQGEEILIDFR